MQGENQFWKGVISGLNPHWSVELGRSWTASNGSISGNEFRIYAVDVETGWVGCAAMPQSEVVRMIHKAPESGITQEMARDAAAQLVSEAGRSEMKPGADGYETAMMMAVLGITKTRTFALGLQQGGGSMAGHWIYVVYRSRSGEFIGRPAMMQTADAGLLNPAKLMGFVRQIIRTDTSSPESSVGKMLAGMGGPVVWSGLK